MSWDSPKNFLEHLVQTSLLPASVAYGLGAYARIKLGYGTRLLKRTRLPATVISVGNLTCGGTGKTPVVIDFARQLTAANYKVAILSRGYKRTSKAPYLVVSDGQSILADAMQAGDEPLLIAEAVPFARVIVGSNRVKTGSIAINELNADVILLDDGFQHIRLMRDHDIVLVDYGEDLEEAYLLPAGRLREPVSALGRATSIVITKVPIGCDSERMAQLTRQLRKYNKKADITFCQFKPVSTHNLKGQKAIAFCGIAKPNHFFNSVRQLGGELIKVAKFDDHHWYSQAELKKLDAEAKKYKAEILITTEKDLVRIPESMRSAMQCPIIALHQETQWLNGAPSSIQEMVAKTGARELAGTRQS